MKIAVKCARPGCMFSARIFPHFSKCFRKLPSSFAPIRCPRRSSRSAPITGRKRRGKKRGRMGQRPGTEPREDRRWIRRTELTTDRVQDVGLSLAARRQLENKNAALMEHNPGREAKQ